MKEPCVRCPAGTVRRRVTDGDVVVACAVVMKEHLGGASNYPHWEVLPSNCEDDHYLECSVWMEECQKGWKNNIGAGKKYSTLEQARRIRI